MDRRAKGQSCGCPFAFRAGSGRFLGERGCDRTTSALSGGKEELADRLRACKWREPADRVYQSKQVESARTCLCTTDHLLAFGGLYELQEICVARALWLKSGNALIGNEVMPLLFLAQNMIPASMLPEELLWHRNREGETCYLGSFPEETADTVIMPPALGQEKRFYSLFVKMEAETGSSLWKELAKPLWLRYGIPEYLAGILALRFVYRTIKGKDFSAMEKFLTQKEVTLRDMVWVAREDVFLLAEMAMAGIEMLPRQERLSWQQIKAFYILLCR